MEKLIEQNMPARVTEPGIQHDLRNLLATLSLDAEHLEGLKNACGCSCENCQTGKHASLRLIRISQRIEALLLGRAQVPHADGPNSRMLSPAVPPNASVREILLDAIEALKPMIPGSMRILVDLPGLLTRADSMDVFRILFNLLRNITDVAATSGGAVEARVTGATVAGQVSIAVRDDGPGLPPDVKARFNRVPHPPAGLRPRGQGLLIARFLAARNGGAVRLASSGPSGTIMVIELPAASRKHIQTKTRPESSPNGYVYDARI
jgi:signal transduction histidine kinase